MKRRPVRTGVSLVEGLFIAGIAGAAGYFATKELLSRTPKGKCPPGEHVGAHGFDWPEHKDLFFDDTGFGEALESFGYETDYGWVTDPESWHPCNDSFREVVSRFQHDWNRLRTDFPDAPGELDTSGLIDRKTINAMVFVHELQLNKGVSWLLLILESEGA